MINLVIGKDTRCKIPNKWNEITIQEYAKVVSLLQQYDVQDVEKIEDEHAKEKQKLKNVKANRDVFEYLSKVPRNIIEKCEIKQMSQCLEVMSNFLNSKIDKEIVKDEQPQSFKHKGKEYFFPLPKMTETTFGDYIEAEQVTMNNKDVEGGRFGVIARQMAILCKEKGEVKTDALVDKKERLFATLPMDIVWQFVFFLMKQTDILRKSLAMSSKMVNEMKADIQPKIGT